MRREILGNALHEIDQGGLGSTVGRVGLRTDLSGHRAHQAKGAARLLDRFRSKSMGQMNGPHEVDLKDAGPVAWAQVPEREPIFTRARPHGVDGVI